MLYVSGKVVDSLSQVRRRVRRRFFIRASVSRKPVDSSAACRLASTHVCRVTFELLLLFDVDLRRIA